MSDVSSHEMSGFFKRFLIKYRQTGGSKMDWITGMQKAIDYIEENLTEEIDYEKVAAKCSIVCISAVFITGSKFGLVIRISNVVTTEPPT